MAKQRVVVEADLGVEAEQLPVLGDDQRIDLEQAHVRFGERLVEPGEHAAHLLLQIGVEAERLAKRGAHDAGRCWRRIDRDGDDLVRRVVRDLLDVHAAFGRHHDGDARGGAVDQHREIELLLDGGAFLDVEPVDQLALGAGLMRDQRRAEDAGRFLLHVVDRLHDLDAAGLAAAAGVDLRLHHPHRAAERLRGLHRLIDREGRDALGRARRTPAAPLWPGTHGCSCRPLKRRPVYRAANTAISCRDPARSSGRLRPGPSRRRPTSRTSRARRRSVRARRCARRPSRRSPPERRHRDS